MFNVISYYSQSYGPENSLRQNKLLYTCTCILDFKYICQTNTCIAMVFIHSLFYYHIEFVSYLQKYFLPCLHNCHVISLYKIFEAKFQYELTLYPIECSMHDRNKRKCNFEHSKFFDQIVNLSLTLTFCSCK